MESRFFEPPRETKIGSKNRSVQEIGGKIAVFHSGGETPFGSSYWEVRKNEGSRNRDSTVTFNLKIGTRNNTDPKNVFLFMHSTQGGTLYFRNKHCLVGRAGREKRMRHILFQWEFLSTDGRGRDGEPSGT